jgi:hypothetical protein
MSKLSEDIQRLKQFLNPDRPEVNIIEQCRIIHEAIHNPESEYYEDRFELARLLDISKNKLYKMDCIHRNLHPKVKEWFSGTDYQMSLPYDVSTYTDESQLEWLYNVEILEGKHI